MRTNSKRNLILQSESMMKTERPTPETEAAVVSHRQRPFLLLETCKRLERERDEARKALDDIAEYGTEEINAAVDLRHALAAALVERDEAREALENHKAASIHTCHDNCKRPMCVLRRERDAERALADRLAGQLEPLAWLAGYERPNAAELAMLEWKEARSD